MGKLIRCITKNGAVTAICADTADIVSTAEKYHKTSAVVTAALGRLLTAASLMGNCLKGKNDSLTLRVAGNGPVGTVVAASDSEGNVRGYVTNPIVEIPLNAKGKLDVGGAVGTGTLTVIKDLGMKEPYAGQVPLVSGEIAEDITSYFATSEQVPTVCALGVLVNPDLTVKAAGGFIIQLLPGAGEKDISKLEEAVNGMEPVTKLLASGKTPKEIVYEALKNFEIEVLYEQAIAYKCKCSRKRTISVLKGIGEEELRKMSEEGKDTEVVCHFCNKRYIFTPEEIIGIISK